MSEGTSTKKSMLWPFMVSAIGTLFSRVAGALRDITIAHVFGASRITDIFWIAFTIPNVFRRFVADEGLTGVLIPALAREEKQHGRVGAESFSHVGFTFLVVLNIIICIVGIAGAPVIVTLFGYGFTRTPQVFETAVLVTRWLFPFVMFVSFVSFGEGILNYRDHFFLPKIAPGIVSLAIIGAILFLHNRLDFSLAPLIVGVLIGGFIHALIILPMLSKRWVLPRLSFAFNTTPFRRFMKEMGKVILIGVFAQINIMVLRTLASMLEAGSVTWFWYAIRLIDLAQGTIVVAMGSALLPRLSVSISAQNIEESAEKFDYALSMTSYFMIPVGFFLGVMALPVISILFHHGDFTYHDSVVSARILILLIPFMLGLSVINIVKKAYFALDLRNPLLISGGLGVCATFLLGLAFIPWMKIEGLGLALSISTVLQGMFLLLLLKLRHSKLISLKKLAMRLSLHLLLVVPFILPLKYVRNSGQWFLGPTVPNVLILSFAFGVAFVMYHLLGTLIGVSESREISRLVWLKVKR